MKDKTVCVVGLGYVGLPLNFLASLKPLLKNKEKGKKGV